MIDFKIPLVTLVVISTFSSCTSDAVDEVDCSASGLELTVSLQTNPTSCDEPNGKISVEGSGGKAPYQYALNTGSFSSSDEFEDLSAGTYTIHLKDANSCEVEIEVTLTLSGSDLAAVISTVTDSGCETDNGEISIAASGGVPPYQYKLDNGAFGSTSSFTGLEGGEYELVIKDSNGCEITKSTTVNSDTGLKYNTQIKAIFTSRCATASCHGGGQSPNLTSISTIQANKSGIRSRILSGAMPKNNETNMTESERNLVICWIDDGAKNN